MTAEDNVMSINFVPFQKGLSMVEFMQYYGTEAKSYRALYRARLVNVLLANVKRAISGSCRAIRQRKYARLYLAEARYRFKRRFRLHELLLQLARVMMLCKPHSETHLHLASNYHG